MAHEISHVALRHQTNQASKAYLAKAGVGVLGGLLGGSSRAGSQIIQAVGGFGLNTLFLRYSRSAEQQADIVGAQIMARAGYDPNDMARFFDLLRQEAGRDPGKVERFFSDHPAPADRAARVRQEASKLSIRLTPQIGYLASAQRELRQLPPAPTLAQAMKGHPASTSDPGTAQGTIESPSSRYRVYRSSQGLFEMQIPENWQARASTYGATIVPRGGIEQASSGKQELRAGVIVNHYVPFDGSVGSGYQDPGGSLFGSTSLEEATSDLVRQIMNANTYLKPVSGSTRRGNVSGTRSVSLFLEGAPPGTGDQERMMVTTRELQDGHVIYVLSLAKESDYPVLEPAFNNMLRTLRVNDNSTHE